EGKDATCTEDGLTDGIICSVCGEVIKAQEPIKATGHNYVNGTCTNCGEKDPNAELTDAKLVFMAKALNMEDSIGLQCIMQKKLANSYDRVYVLAEYADGTTTEIAPIVYMSNFYVFEVQVLPNEMVKEVTVTLYGEKEGVAYKGESTTQSVRSMGMAILTNANQPAIVKTVAADMLNYGAAVQTQFNLNVDDLANALMTEEHQAYATVETPAMSSTNTEIGNGKTNPVMTALSMEAKVEMQFIFNKKDMSAYEAHVTMNGETTVVDGADFDPYYSYRVLRIAIDAGNMRESYEITFHDKSTGEQVSKTYTCSVQAYANGLLGSANNDLVIAMMKYGDAVAAYIAS
ncbi:MAG: hypothetical protein IIY04_02135, partial [Oscillospiraceae bacterium]|nr:hypothetical protein [Oscillospiraceae bacterium]